MSNEISPAVPTPAASVIDKLDALLASDEGKAIEAAVAQKLAAKINRLPTAGHATPGVKTSEFWCLVVFFLVSLLTLLAGAVQPQCALAGQAVAWDRELKDPRSKTQDPKTQERSQRPTRPRPSALDLGS